MHSVIPVIAVILLAAYLIIYSLARKRILFSVIIPSVLSAFFLSYNYLLTYFHKKGVFTHEQAAEFYTKCRERNISLFQDSNIEKAKDIYFSVFGTDKYIGDGTLPAHMEKIYNAGKETTEKQ